MSKPIEVEVCLIKLIHVPMFHGDLHGEFGRELDGTGGKINNVWTNMDVFPFKLPKVCLCHDYLFIA